MFSNTEQSVTVSHVLPGPAAIMTVRPQRIPLRSSATASARPDTPSTALVVPPMGQLQLVPGSGAYLVAEHITAALPYGSSVAVRFTFSTGNSVLVDVPMAPPTYPLTGQPPPSVSGPPAG